MVYTRYFVVTIVFFSISRFLFLTGKLAEPAATGGPVDCKCEIVVSIKNNAEKYNSSCRSIPLVGYRSEKGGQGKGDCRPWRRLRGCLAAGGGQLCEWLLFGYYYTRQTWLPLFYMFVLVAELLGACRGLSAIFAPSIGGCFWS